MKRNMDQPLTTLDNKPYEDKSTLKNVVFAAVTQPMEEDRAQSVEEKLKCYSIAQRVFAGGEVELTAEEITLIKARIGRLFPVLIVGQAFRMLETEPLRAVEGG